MKLRQLLPTRTSKREFFVRLGLANVMAGWIEAASLGKRTTDWGSLACDLSEDKIEAEQFLNLAAQRKPYDSWRRRPAERAEAAIGGVIRMAEGLVELTSAGYLTVDWNLAWLIYGEDTIEWIASRFRR